MAASPFKLNPRVRWRWEGKDKILLNTMIGMNRTAGEILELCEKLHNADDITEEMSRKYPNVPREKLRSDVEKLIDKLLKWIILISCEQITEIPPVYATPLSAQIVTGYFKNNLSAPVEVVLELTYCCNAGCRFCYVSATKNFDPNELTTREWMTVINDVSDIQVFRLTFTGGEALLRPDLEELISYANEKGLRTLLLTNGVGLTENRIQSLLSAGLRGVDISLDGPDPELHDSSRGVPGLFDHITKIIPVLIEKNVNVTVLTSLTKMNVNRIPEIMELLNKLGVQVLFLAPFIPVGRGAEHLSLAPSIKDYVTMLSQVHKKQEELSTPVVISYAFPVTYYENSIGLETYEQLVREGRIIKCGAGITDCIIEPSGNLKPCRVSEGIVLGNIKKNSLKDLWLKPPIFKHLRSITKKDQLPCLRCKFSEICIAGCNAQPMQISSEGDLYTADFECKRCFETFKPHLEGKNA